MTPPSPTVTDATTTAGAAGPRLVAGRRRCTRPGPS